MTLPMFKKSSKLGLFISFMMIICLFVLKPSTFDNSNKLRFFNYKDVAFFWKEIKKCTESLPYTEFNSTFVFCGHDTSEDIYLSIFFQNYMRYDIKMMTHFLTAAHQYQDLYVLDIGSNLGPYTLAAAALNHKVISVDPVPWNHAFVFNSLVHSMAPRKFANNSVFTHNSRENNVIQIINAVSDSYTLMKAHQPEKTNPGKTLLFDIEYQESSKSQDPSHYIQSVLFEDILELVPENVPIALKIDVEGYECKALMKFLKSEIKMRYIPYIMIELINACVYEDLCPNYQEFLEAFHKSGYKAYLPKYTPHEELVKKFDKTSTYLNCPMYAFFVHETARPLELLQTDNNFTFSNYDAYEFN